MDARAFRPRAAENNVASLHQRHKSTGTLPGTTASSVALGFQGPARRHAFGDVTNQNRSTHGLRDEERFGKNPWTATFLPALPSSSVINKENLIRNHNHHNNNDTHNHAPSRPATAASKPRAIVNFRARPSEDAKHLSSTSVTESVTHLARGGLAFFKPKTTDESKIPPHHHRLPSQILHETSQLQPRHHRSQPQLKVQQPPLRRTQSRSFEKRAFGLERPLTAGNPAPAAAIVSVRVEQPTTAYAEYSALPCQTIGSLAVEEMIYVDSYPGGLPSPVPEISEEADQAHSFPQHRRKIAPTGPDEWDEEGVDEDGEEVTDGEGEQLDYDEQDQGYTTIQSFRSRDMTTGGLTTLLAPRVTARVQAELDEAKLEVLETRCEEEIADEKWDVSMVSEYGEEIFDYFQELEIKMLPSPYYIEIQSEITWSMRAVLMDWLVQVHDRFSLLPETLFLTVNYIDRFLSYKIVSIGKLQLVGATAILVASKYEEINCPSFEEIVYMVDGGYSGDEILKAERFMLSMLNFELGWPGPMSFLRRVSKADDYDFDTRTLAKYFLELTIMDERFVASPPSFLAAGAHCLAREILNKGHWTLHHVHYSGYTWSQLKPLVSMIIGCCLKPRLHHCSIYEKYKDKRFKEAATLVQHALDAGFILPHQSKPIRPLRAVSSSAREQHERFSCASTRMDSPEG